MTTPDPHALSQLMDGEWQDLKPGEAIAGICHDATEKARWQRYHLIRDVMRSEALTGSVDLSARISAAIRDEPEYSNVRHLDGAPSTAAGVADGQTGSVAALSSSALMTGDPSVQADRVGESPAAVALTSASSSRSGASLLRTGLTGFALVASVALVTVVGLSVWQGGAPGDGLDRVASAGTERDVVSTQVAEAPLSPDSTARGAGTDVFSTQLDGEPLPEVELVANDRSYWISPETTERSPSEQRLNMFLSQHIENSPTAVRQGMLPYSRLVGYDEQVSE